MKEQSVSDEFDATEEDYILFADTLEANMPRVYVEVEEEAVEDTYAYYISEIRQELLFEGQTATEKAIKKLFYDGISIDDAIDALLK